MITLQDVLNLPDVHVYIEKADECLKSIGYTEHSHQHVGVVMDRAASILTALGYPERMVELGRIAACLHDVGNIVNRHDHAQSSALMAFRLLDQLGMPADEISDVVCAIGNHDESTGLPINPLAAALIISDKTDVRQNRVRMPVLRVDDIHDRVNGSVIETHFDIDASSRVITLQLTIDTDQCPVMEYFEIFLTRMRLCQRAAKYLNCQFRLMINGATMLS